jgi:probable rRNA maturation factor
MIAILIKTDSHYSVDRTRIRKVIEQVLTEKGVKGKIEVSLSVVGDRLMRQLNKQYRDLDKTTDVLSFSHTEEVAGKPFVDPPDGILRLGDIVVSYPKAVDEAGDDNMLVDDKIDELVAHGMLHLLGIHHD